MFPKSFKKLIDHFSSLPSVGPKMAERLVLYLFKLEPEKLNDFADSLSNLKSSLSYCRKCFNISEGEICEICRNTKRNQKIICVVEEPLDIIAIERTRRYEGIYHVLGGVLNSFEEKDNQKLRIKELEMRIEKEKPEEIILAMNPTTEGDATAMYLKKSIQKYPIKITSLGRGLSTGGDIEYADEITLSEALTNRR
jgi:recombination protein RecR